jgi:aminoglycoside phosphotransferase (APT) family kinase protein
VTTAPAIFTDPLALDRGAAALAVAQNAGTLDPAATIRELRQLAGGWSRHTFALTAHDPATGEDHGLIVRTEAPGATLDSDLLLEYQTYILLQDQPLPIPRVHGVQPSRENPFGGAFFVVDQLPGDAPNVWRRRDREELQADWDGPRGLAEAFVAALAAVHAVPRERVAVLGPPLSFADLVGRWREIWDQERVAPDPVVEAAYAWLGERAPAPVPPTLVHGDYRIGNTLLAGGRITGVLDWELSFHGDPRFDIGYLALPYYAGRLFDAGSPLANAVAERSWLLDRYTALTGTTVDSEVVRTYSAVGALMVIAIMTTGIRRYLSGESRDVRTVWGRFAIAGLRRELTELMAW